MCSEAPPRSCCPLHDSHCHSVGIGMGLRIVEGLLPDDDLELAIGGNEISKKENPQMRPSDSGLPPKEGQAV